jgi:hypothetical protein
MPQFEIIIHSSCPRNRLSPRFINKVKRLNRSKWRGIPLTSGSKIKIKTKKHRACHRRYRLDQGNPSTTTTPPRGWRRNKTLPSSRPKSRVFTRSPNMERVATMTPSRRGLRHPAGVTVIGAKALSFRPEKPSPHLVPRATTCPRAELPTHDLGTDHAEAPPTPGTPDAHPLPPAWPKGISHHHHNTACHQDALQSTFQSRRSGVQDLAPKWQHNTARNKPLEQAGESDARNQSLDSEVDQQDAPANPISRAQKGPLGGCQI